MGVLSKALAPMSSYAAKGGKTGDRDVWGDLADRVAGALLQQDLDDFVEWLDARPLDYPQAYREPLEELIEKRREEIEAEDVNAIIRDRFDFT